MSDDIEAPYDDAAAALERIAEAVDGIRDDQYHFRIELMGVLKEISQQLSTISFDLRMAAGSLPEE